ncbi:hypothetical protein ASE33_18255 [Pseudomonas sp. Root9]|nr:hypothetical protein ASE33_18255 [Pseudomonas sp. Root9]
MYDTPQAIGDITRLKKLTFFKTFHLHGQPFMPSGQSRLRVFTDAARASGLDVNKLPWRFTGCARTDTYDTSFDKDFASRDIVFRHMQRVTSLCGRDN